MHPPTLSLALSPLNKTPNMAGTSSDPIDLSFPTRGEVIDLATGDGERTDAGHRVENGQCVAGKVGDGQGVAGEVENGQGAPGEVAGGCSEAARAYMARQREIFESQHF